MSKPIEPKREHGDETFIRQQISHARDASLVRRLQVILYRMQGKSPALVGSLTDFSSETIRNCIHRWNQDGVTGLYSKPRSGRPRKLDDGIRNLVFKKIEGTLDDGEPFTAITFHGYLKKTDIR